MAPTRRVRIRNGGLRAEVDEHLASLVETLWDYGFKTLKGCHQEGGAIHFELGSAEEASRLRVMGTRGFDPCRPEVLGDSTFNCEGSQR